VVAYVEKTEVVTCEDRATAMQFGVRAVCVVCRKKFKLWRLSSNISAIFQATMFK